MVVKFKMPDTVNIYYINGLFLVFQESEQTKLLNERIICQPGGLLSHYGASICHERNLATFKRLTPRNVLDHASELSKPWSEKLDIILDEARTEFIHNRTTELNDRGIEITSQHIGTFEDENLRIPISNLPDPNVALATVDDFDFETLKSSLSLDNRKLDLYRDLYSRGFYITAGTKYGGDFLAYQGDPSLLHSTYLVRLVPSTKGKIDLSMIDFKELNALHRLCQSVNKKPLFAFNNSDEDTNMVYMSLSDRQYIGPNRKLNHFQPMDPQVSDIIDRKLYKLLESKSDDVDSNSIND